MNTDKFFRIREPTCISFSGGRTSAYMLWRFIQANNGIPNDSVIAFANTGKEMGQTLDFVRDCAKNWNVRIVWLEYQSAKKTEDRFKVVDFHTAARNGEPFDELISDKNYLPNPCARFCTSELKVVPIEKYMRSIGIGEFQTAVGIRADEPRRVVKMRGKENYLVPLADVGCTVKDVVAFWRKQPFNLQLPEHGDFSNCDLCFLKRQSLKKAIVKESPNRALWWAKHEAAIGAKFRVDHQSYREMYERADEQIDLFGADDETIACFCGD